MAQLPFILVYHSPVIAPYKSPLQEWPAWSQSVGAALVAWNKNLGTKTLQKELDEGWIEYLVGSRCWMENMPMICYILTMYNIWLTIWVEETAQFISFFLVQITATVGWEVRHQQTYQQQIVYFTLVHESHQINNSPFWHQGSSYVIPNARHMNPLAPPQLFHPIVKLLLIQFY